MPADVASNFAAAGGMADVDHVLKIEVCDQLGKVIGIGIKIVAVPGLAGAAMAATVMGDGAVDARGEKKHLVLEGIRAQRPAVAEHNRLSLAPVVEIDLGSVFAVECRHRLLLLRAATPAVGQLGAPRQSPLAAAQQLGAGCGSRSGKHAACIGKTPDFSGAD